LAAVETSCQIKSLEFIFFFPFLAFRLLKADKQQDAIINNIVTETLLMPFKAMPFKTMPFKTAPFKANTVIPTPLMRKSHRDTQILNSSYQDGYVH
jgi:hypothetical protein